MSALSLVNNDLDDGSLGGADTQINGIRLTGDVSGFNISGIVFDTSIIQPFAWDPNGTLNGHIEFWDPRQGQQGRGRVEIDFGP